MKNSKTTLYDDACPLCSWYTGAIVKTGLLDKEGRKVPLILLNRWLPGLGSLNYIYFILLTIFIIKEYFRRMQYAGVTKTHRNVVIINLVCLTAFVASLFVL